MPLWETLSNSITFAYVNEYDKSAFVAIETVFWPIYLVACQVVLWNETL